MANAGVPLGLVVTLDRVAVLRNRYTGSDPDSIAVLGDYETTGIFGSSNSEVVFEAGVRRWLDGLSAGSGWELLPSGLAEVLRDEVVPALRAGAVRTSGPRFESHATP